MTDHYHRWATPSRQPVVSGEPCPANRTRPNRVRRISPVRRGQALTGVTDCPMCGAVGVEVRASTNENYDRMTAFYYQPHVAP